MKIDLVYLWVDGNDPEWQAKLSAFTGENIEVNSARFKGRHIDSNELMFSLRSVEKNANWINKIYIVTDNQTPSWLNSLNPKVSIIDHKTILSKQMLPCFNSNIIEHNLYKIPDLSEHFIYANDDMFINKPVQPNVFFTNEGFPVIRFVWTPFRQFRMFLRGLIPNKVPLQYRHIIVNASNLVKKKFGIYYSAMPHHNIDAYLKSDCKRVVEDIFKDEIGATLINHIRNNSDIERVIYQYVALAEKRGCLKYVNEKESLYVGIHKDKHFHKLIKKTPTFFCMNDNSCAKDIHRVRMKEYLEKSFPEKSSFEL